MKSPEQRSRDPATAEAGGSLTSAAVCHILLAAGSHG